MHHDVAKLARYGMHAPGEGCTRRSRYCVWPMRERHRTQTVRDASPSRTPHLCHLPTMCGSLLVSIASSFTEFRNKHERAGGLSCELARIPIVVFVTVNVGSRRDSNLYQADDGAATKPNVTPPRRHVTLHLHHIMLASVSTTTVSIGSRQNVPSYQSNPVSTCESLISLKCKYLPV